jgi:hypothetical protein
VNFDTLLDILAENVVCHVCLRSRLRSAVLRFAPPRAEAAMRTILSHAG